MAESSDMPARTQRFTAAVRAYAPPSPSRHAKLTPFKDGIVELRQKGASLRLIRELLATVNVAVGTDTIARFIAEVTGQSAPARPADRRRRNRPAVPNVTHAHPANLSAMVAASLPVSAPCHPPNDEPPTDRVRTRGPRIADPRNL